MDRKKRRKKEKNALSKLQCRDQGKKERTLLQFNSLYISKQQNQGDQGTLHTVKANQRLYKVETQRKKMILPEEEEEEEEGQEEGGGREGEGESSEERKKGV